MKFFLFILLLLVACQTTPPPAVAPQQATRTLTLLFQSNRYGNLETCDCHSNPFGGIDREFNAIESVRKTSPILMLDAGNLFVPKDLASSIDYYKARSIQIAPLFTELGLDVYAPGPHDLALGLPTLQEIAKAQPFKWVATNVAEPSGIYPFPRFVTIDRGGVRIGILSATPASVIGNWLVSNPREALKSVLPQVTGQTDIVILLSQLGNAEDIRLAEEFPSIHVIVGSDPILSTERPQWFAGHTLVVDPDLNGYLLGKLRLDLLLPLRSFYSPMDIQSNEALLKEYKDRASEGNGAYQSYAQKLTKEAQLAIPTGGGSLYEFDLIKLDEKRFGSANRLTLEIQRTKGWSRRYMLKKKR